MKIEVVYKERDLNYPNLYPERFIWRIIDDHGKAIHTGSVGTDCRTLKRARKKALNKAREVAALSYYGEDYVPVNDYDALQSRIQRLEAELLDNPN